MGVKRRFVRNKLYVWERDGGICRYCGFPGECIDHIVPWSFSYDQGAGNLVCACTRCNTIAGSQVFPTFEAKRDYILSIRRPEILAVAELLEAEEQ